MIDVLPPLEGVTLSGRLKRFPEDLPGSGVILVVGFSHGARHDVGAWKRALAERGLPFLSLPTSVLNLPFEEMEAVAQAMWNQVPAEAWEEVVQIHHGGEALLSQFGWKADAFAKLLRVTQDGRVTARHDEGPFSPEALATFLG